MFTNRVIPWHIRVLQTWHEYVGLEPSKEQFLRRCSVVAITANHVWEDKSVANNVHLQQRRDQRWQAISISPFGIFVKETNKNGQVLCALRTSHFNDWTERAHSSNIRFCYSRWMIIQTCIQFWIL